MSDEPKSTRAVTVSWADFSFLCPCCGVPISTGDDWEEDIDGTWRPGDSNRFLRCDPFEGGCDALVELPNITVHAQ